MGMVLKKMITGTRPSSPLMAAIEAAVAQRIAADPGSVPPGVLARAAGWSPTPHGSNHLIGHDTWAAGWRHGRLPGLRDMVGEFHPVFDRMMVVARDHEGPSCDEFRATALIRPASAADLWQASIYRWSAWFGVGCALDDVYRDAKGRHVLEPGYAGEAYDADHAPDELLRQTLDVRLIDWICLLDALRTSWPELFEAVWGRDAAAVERLLKDDRPLPAMAFLRMRQEGRDRFRAVVAIFWEAERLFELLHAFGGRARVTMTRLRHALATTSFLGGEIKADTRTGRYVATSWCHRRVLAMLFGKGVAVGHDPRHPHHTFGPGGTPTITDELLGCVTDAARNAAILNISTAPPFVHDSRLRPVGEDLPVHFFVGREVRLMAVMFFIEVRQWLGPNPGRKAVQDRPAFEVDGDSAIGRLALLIIARLCPDTARAVIADVVPTELADHHSLPRPIGPADFVANPRAWFRLHTGVPDTTSIPFRSQQLGKYVLATMVRETRDDRERFVRSDPATLGHTIAFVPDVWFEPHREAAMLAEIWRRPQPDLETAFPDCFDRNIDLTEVVFCAEVAATIQPSAIDPWHDLHCRKPDKLRRGARGRPRKKVAPPAARLTAAQQLTIARIRAVQKRGTVIPPITML